MMSRAAAGSAADGWTALGAPVQLVVTDPARLEKGRAMLTAGLAAADAACNRARPDSELALLDRPDADLAGPDGDQAGPADRAGESVRVVRVSPLLADAIAVALRTARLTDGDVDPTFTGAAGLGFPSGDVPAGTSPGPLPLEVLLGPV